MRVSKCMHHPVKQKQKTNSPCGYLTSELKYSLVSIITISRVLIDSTNMLNSWSRRLFLCALPVQIRLNASRRTLIWYDICLNSASVQQRKHSLQIIRFKKKNCFVVVFVQPVTKHMLTAWTMTSTIRLLFKSLFTFDVVSNIILNFMTQ